MNQWILLYYNETSGWLVFVRFSEEIDEPPKDISKLTDLYTVSETWQKKDSERCMFIVQLILLPHDLNDSKWFEMNSYDFSWLFGVI